MLHNRGLAATFVGDDEGGFAIRKDEPGGAVNRGITFQTFKIWREKQGKPIPTFDDLKNISLNEATEIYGQLYFDPIGFDDLPSGLDYILANTAIMQGVTGAKKMHSAAQMFSGGDTLATCLGILLVQACAKLKSRNVFKYGGGWADRFLREATRAASMMGK